ncbi:hypothetical protein AAFC00_000616 [Neodothiora populina]|uniref:S-adenosyl-L-methionine-dependent methyltransferase n=1 Tax=Neodothiora populina TaxID=2781224 RepID=A0ABR3PE10_9PEZI
MEKSPEIHGITTLLSPLTLLLLSATYIPITIFKLVKHLEISKLFSWSAFQHAWFGTFWAFLGPRAREMGVAEVVPLLKHAEGVILDIGPGSGEWLNLFSPSENTKIRKIYGVEPNYEHHATLRRRIQEAGLQDIYEILGVGAQDLAGSGIEKGSIDTICTVQCLCSVPGPQDIIRELYPYLKPGGKWLVYEHVQTKFRKDFVGYWQSLIDVIWPTFFDGCSITRPTDEWLQQAGEWASVDLNPGAGEYKYDVIPHAIGVLVKSS